MSDELERRLRDAGHRLAGPTESETGAARARFLGAAETPPRRRGRRRTAALALAFAVAVGGAFGVGFGVASRGQTTPVDAKRPLDSGPGFLPASGWDTVATGTTAPPRGPTAFAANVPLAARDRQLLGPPAATARTLGPNGVLFFAMIGPAQQSERLPQRTLPLQLDDAKAVDGFEGMPRVGSTRRLQVRVAAYDLDVLVFFGAKHPSAGVLAAAREELGRLAVPACPDAQPLGSADAAAAKAHLLQWLPAHYPRSASDVVGATATAAAGAAAPRSGEAAADCGALVGSRTVEVDVVLPRLEKVSASLSQLTYFLAKTPDGWVVWERVH